VISRLQQATQTGPRNDNAKSIWQTGHMCWVNQDEEEWWENSSSEGKNSWFSFVPMESKGPVK
jgi:hypothetical protein